MSDVCEPKQWCKSPLAEPQAMIIAADADADADADIFSDRDQRRDDSEAPPSGKPKRGEARSVDSTDGGPGRSRSQGAGGAVAGDPSRIVGGGGHDMVVGAHVCMIIDAPAGVLQCQASGGRLGASG